ncbi:LysR family transcriptional regulator [Paracoccus caeni]|uniref:LysR family transcriptional regulator n=1 Tax=Paracoccus caeni TaxID=657651 RepID=A0A934W0X4_9RHOB|nr:LysR family transcriptional regulator [Paracoccus caeni]MBK4216798.1 LysR family transcriptional regulator [Paracoccus caeni]
MSARPAIELADLKSFVCVVETGSIAQAASRQGVAKSIISRRINRLECVLGATLLVRAPRGTSPTDIGREYYLQAAEGVAQLEQAQEAVGKAVGEVSGPIRVSIPLGIGETFFAPLLADFAKEHPKIQIDLCFEDRADVVAGGFDLAVQAGNLRDSSLITRKLTKVRTVIVASPDYLDMRGRPIDPVDLAEHDVVVDSNCTSQWTLIGTSGCEQVRVNTRLRTNNKHMLLAAARAGVGIVAIPHFMACSLIDSGEIEIVLPDYTHEEVGIHLLVPPSRVKIARVRALMDYLSGNLSVAV